MEFKATAPEKYARTSASVDARQAAEERYWRGFKSSVFIKSYAPIASLHFSQATPHRYAVTSGTRIQIYSSKTNRVVKTISKFKEIARSGHIRDDGKLVIAADDSGLVQVFDVNSRAVLRSLRAHKQPVHTTAFSPTSTSHGSPTLLSASDDTTLKVYDLSTSSQISYLAGHADYVRTAAYVPTNPSLIVSGSYDGTVKLWDTRIPAKGARQDDDEDAEPGLPVAEQDEEGMAREVMSFKHGHPVERILVHPNGTQVVSAGGSVVRVWDIMSSAGCLHAMSNHQKTVTCLEWGDGRPYAGGSKKRLLSAGLDGLIKSYNVEDNYRVGKTMRVGSGVLSLAMSPDESLMLIGCANGELAIRKRVLSASERQAKAVQVDSTTDSAAQAAAGAADVFNAVQAEINPDAEGVAQPAAVAGQLQREIVVKGRRKHKTLKDWDKHLKSFRYADALDAALDKGVPVNLTFAVLSELMHRDGLHQALNARDEVSLLPILRFLFEHIADSRYGSIACDITNVLIDLYGSVLGQSVVIGNLFDRLKQKIEREIAFQHSLKEVSGQLEMILAVQGAA